MTHSGIYKLFIKMMIHIIVFSKQIIQLTITLQTMSIVKPEL